ncbi:MAG TPA: phosphatidylinositol-specific phospholipase C domain-containing protein [Thermoanaerobaculia bacterium]|nr:phosphatidylinositol-specific phospholipase C domain-containing protein [Thermoanaerobaculia bacterium]
MPETDLDLRFDQVCFVGTHNSFTGNFTLTTSAPAGSNQDLPILEQLRRGVRFLQLDIYRHDDGSFYCKHGGYFLDSVPLSTCLDEVATFLQEDPSAVVAISMEPHVSFSDDGVVRALLDQYVQAGLWQMMFDPERWKFDEFQRWPTLRQMAGTYGRLVLFAENRVSKSDDDFRRILYMWDYAVENVYGKESLEAPTWTDARSESLAISATNRGLFVMNHFWNVTNITDLPTPIPLPDLLESVNNSEFIARHVEEMRALYFRTPNFINVNYFERGSGGGPETAATMFSPAFRLLENTDLRKRFEMTGNIYLEVKGKDDKQTMVAQLMDDYKTVTIQPKGDHPGQRWIPIHVQGSAVGIAFINIDRNGQMRALSGREKNADVTVVDFKPGSIPDSIIWKNCERTSSSDFRAIQYGKNSDYNLNVRGSVKTGNKIATWEWSGGDDNERWRFILVT